MFTPLQQKALQIAKSHLGAREATGRNDGPIPQLVQRFIAGGARWLDHQPWCVCYAIYCVHTAAQALGLKSRLPKTASSSSLYRWFKRENLLMSRPKPGCIGMVKGGRTGHQHTFLVHDVRDGLVIGVDGNYKNAVGWSQRPVGACDYGPMI